MDDRHRIWQRISDHYNHLEDTAPEGHEPVVEVFVSGRPEPIEVAYVQTYRGGGPETEWVMFQSVTLEKSPAPRDPSEVWVHVHQTRIDRVEIRFRRQAGEKQGMGFAHRMADEPPNG